MLETSWQDIYDHPYIQGMSILKQTMPAMATKAASLCMSQMPGHEALQTLWLQHGKHVWGTALKAP